MSRAYRIQVKETLRRALKGEDAITTELELLEVLPPEQMAGLLEHELKQRGFEKQPDGKLTRKDAGGSVTVDPHSGSVTVEAKAQETVELEGERDGIGYDDVGPGRKAVSEKLKQDLRHDLEKRAGAAEQKLQDQATEKLQEKLCDLEKEFAGVINRVTIEALKQKAKQLGQVKEISENAERGELTIKLEV